MYLWQHWESKSVANASWSAWNSFGLWSEAIPWFPFVHLFLKEMWEHLSRLLPELGVCLCSQMVLMKLTPAHINSLSANKPSCLLHDFDSLVFHCPALTRFICCPVPPVYVHLHATQFKNTWLYPTLTALGFLFDCIWTYLSVYVCHSAKLW